MAREQEPQGTYSKGPGGIRIYHPSRGEILGAQIGGLAERLRNISAPSPLEIAGSATGILVFAEPVLTASHDEIKNTSLVSPTSTPGPKVEVAGAAISLHAELPANLVDPLSAIIADSVYNPPTLQERSFIAPSGVPVLLAELPHEAVSVELATTQHIDHPTPEDVAKVAGGKWADLLSDLDESYSAAILDQGGLYAFSKDRVSVTLFSDQATTEITTPTEGPFYTPKLRWMNGMGIVGTNGFHITHQYDAAAKQWTELDTYIALGTPEQRIRVSLEDLLTTTVDDNGNQVANPLGLNADEVRTYVNGTQQEGFKTFEVVNDAQGKPAFIIVLGGPGGSPYGLKPEIGNLDPLRQAVKRLNEADSTIIRALTDQNGLRAFSGDTPPFQFPTHPSYGATFNAKLGILQYKDHDVTNIPDHMLILLAESRGIWGGTHLVPADGKWKVQAKNALSDNQGIDKALWTRKWADEHKAQLSEYEYKFITIAADGSMVFYTRNG